MIQAYRHGLRALAPVAVLLTLLCAGCGSRSDPVSAGTGGSSAALGIGSLATEHLQNPLGLDTQTPRLAWTLTSTRRGVMQSAYQILVASSAEALAAERGDVWDSGRVDSAESYEVTYAGPALQPRTTYHWKVRAWDNQGQGSGWSVPARFETAFFDPAVEWPDSESQWIGRQTSLPGVPALLQPAEREPLLRREFSIDRRISRARAYISGLGFHELYLNGRRVGDHVLDPGYTTYNVATLYVVHDVTALLQQGGNAVGVRLGRGNYAVKSSPTIYPLQIQPWNAEPKLKLRIDIDYADGGTERIASDTQWKTAEGPTVSDHISGEIYDARLEIPGWELPGFDDSEWDAALKVPAPGGILRAQVNEPIKVVGKLSPVTTTEPVSGYRVYDFHWQNTGWVRLEVLGEAGTELKISYSEKLNPDGTVLEMGGQVDRYTLKGGGPEVFEPRYGYKGFRYAQLSVAHASEVPTLPGLPPPPGPTPEGAPLPQILSIESRIVHNAVATAGGFNSSSELFNRYNDAMRRTVLYNLHSVPEDTPVYEKAGWAADAHLYGEAAIRNFGMASFFEKWMRDFADAQLPLGHIGVIVPTPLLNTVFIDPVWSGAVVFIHHYLYMNYGDLTALRRGYPMMKRWMGLYETLLSATGHVYVGFTFGDWCPPEGQATNTGQNMSPMGTLFLIRAAREMSVIAGALGEAADAEHYKELEGRIIRAYNQRFFNPITRSYDGDLPGAYFQTLNLLPLSLGLVPEDRLQDVVENLVEDVAVHREGHLWTGASGTKVILPVLSDHGHADLAYTIATKPTFPGWGYWFQDPDNNTMHEEWKETGRSRGHAFQGTVDDWLYTHVAGIRPVAPAFREIRLKPHVVGDLEHARAWQTTPLGRVSSGWSRSGDTLTLDVEVPVGATAQVHVPGNDPAAISETAQRPVMPAQDAEGIELVGQEDGHVILRLGSGRYRFVTRLTPDQGAP